MNTPNANHQPSWLGNLLKLHALARPLLDKPGMLGSVWKQILQDQTTAPGLADDRLVADDQLIVNMQDQLPIVVSDVLLGKDIPRLYPRFYRELLRNPQLLADFLEMLDDLSTTEVEETPEQPPERGFDLSFVHKSTGKAHVASWGYTVEQLQKTFSAEPKPAALPYRHSQQGLSGDHFILLREKALFGSQEFEVRLDGYLLLDAGEQLFPFLRILNRKTKEDQPLYAQLTWGNYVDAGKIGEDGSYEFQPLSFAQLLDENAAVRAPLFLSLTHS